MTNYSSHFSASHIGHSAGNYSYRFIKNDTNGNLAEYSPWYTIDVKRVDTVVNITSSNGFQIQEGISNTVTCQHPATTTAVMTKDGLVIDNPYTATLYFGQYAFYCSVAATQNYTSGATSQILYVSSTGFGCTTNTTYAFEINFTVGAGVNETVFDMTTLHNSNLINIDMYDVYVSTNTSPQGWRNMTNKLLILNTSYAWGNLVNVRFGNLNRNSTWTQKANSTQPIAFTYSQIHPYIIYTVLNERTGVEEIPTNANVTLSLYCNNGATDLDIKN